MLSEQDIDQAIGTYIGFKLLPSQMEDFRDFARAIEAAVLAAQPAEPVAWMDDFGNAFPLGAIKGAGSWRDEHQRNWRPLYTAPPAPAAVPTEEQVMQAIRSLGAEGQGRITLTYETGPYDIDKPTLVAMRFARAMIAASQEKT